MDAEDEERFRPRSVRPWEEDPRVILAAEMREIVEKRS